MAAGRKNQAEPGLPGTRTHRLHRGSLRSREAGGGRVRRGVEVGQ